MFLFLINTCLYYTQHVTNLNVCVRMCVGSIHLIIEYNFRRKTCYFVYCQLISHNLKFASLLYSLRYIILQVVSWLMMPVVELRAYIFYPLSRWKRHHFRTTFSSSRPLVGQQVHDAVVSSRERVVIKTWLI